MKPTKMFREILIGLVIFTSLAINYVDAKRLTNKTVYLAVIPMAGYEKYYLDVSLLNLERIPSQIFKNEKGEVKWTTCETLFRHPVMQDLQGADNVDPLEKQVLEEIQTKHTGIYERFFKPPNELVLNQVIPQFLNSYRKYNFSVDGVIMQEYAFPCLARNRATNNIEEYLVTVEYLLPREEEIFGYENKVAGRFVFQRNEDTNKTTLIAMFDKASDEVISPHPYYCEREELNEERRSRELCELSDIQRIRLCASFLNSKNFTDVVKYSAPHIVASECRDTKLFLQCPHCSANFSDVVLECKAHRIEGNANRPATYYVSRGLRPHQFFVAVPREDNPVPIVTDVFFSYLFKLTQPPRY